MDKPLHVSAGSIQALTWGVMLGWHHCVGTRAPGSQHSCIKRGRPTLEAAEYGQDPEDWTLSTESISEPAQVERGERGRFLPGKAPKSPGRPRKGRSILDSTQALAERHWKDVAKAAVARLERDDAVGARAWSDYRDTYHGIPKQTLVLEQGSDPLTALFTELAERRQLASGEQDTTQDNAT